MRHPNDPNAPEFRMLNPEAPEFKPIKMRADAAEFVPTSGGWATLNAAAEAYSQRVVNRQMPYATNEEWEQRIAKREKEIEIIKSLQTYRLYIEAIPVDMRVDDAPHTPDPRDRSVSKRMWKWNVEKWRLQLKGRCAYSRETMLSCWAKGDFEGSPADGGKPPEGLIEEGGSGSSGPQAESTRVRSVSSSSEKDICPTTVDLSPPSVVDAPQSVALDPTGPISQGIYQ